MNKIITILIALIIPVLSPAQKIKKLFTGTQVEAGTLANGSAITALYYDMPFRVVGYDLDTERQELFLITEVIKKTTPVDGYVFLYDIRHRSLLWYKEVYGGNFNFVISKNEIIQNIPGRAICYDKITGDRIWQGAKTIIFADRHSNKAVAHNGQVIDVTSGKQLWKRFVESKYGVNDIRYVDSNNVLIAADGVFKIDLANGSSWEYYAKTNWGDPTTIPTIIPLPLGPGAFLGTLATVITASIIVAATPDDVKKGIFTHACSNLLLENNRVYFASSESVFCLDVKTGSRIWDIPLPKNKTSNSRIWISGDNLVLLNNGYVLASDGLAAAGDAYLASFNVWTGKQNYLTEIGGRHIVSSLHFGDTLVADYDHKEIIFYDVKHGKAYWKTRIEDKQLTEAATFVDSRVYYSKTGAGYKRLSEIYPGDIFMRSGKGVILRFSSAVNSTDTFKDEIWEHYGPYKGIDFMRNEKETVLVKDGVEYGRLQMANINIVGNTIVDISNRHLRLCNADDVFRF